jgi:hypothetical protein
MGSRKNVKSSKRYSVGSRYVKEKGTEKGEMKIGGKQDRGKGELPVDP